MTLRLRVCVAAKISLTIRNVSSVSATNSHNVSLRIYAFAMMRWLPISSPTFANIIGFALYRNSLTCLDVNPEERKSFRLPSIVTIVRACAALPPGKSSIELAYIRRRNFSESVEGVKGDSGKKIDEES